MCNKEMPGESTRKSFCSDECQKMMRSIFYVPIVREIRPCINCGELIQKRKDATTCGKKSCLEANNTRKCTEEGCDRPHRAKGLCVKHWNRKYKEEGRRNDDWQWTDAGRANYHIRRARKKNPDGKIENINLMLLAKRDNYICGICHDPVDMMLEYPDRMSPSIDHIIPLSKGGTHTASNVQLAHWLCNTAKGNRTEEGS
jgi:5-methylcytosine-specific restriction endonuclease McrA